MSREWYADGLRFECTMCGACCTGAEGYVLFTEEEAVKIAKRLKITRAEFYAKFTRDTPAGRSLNEMKTEHGFDCVFLDREVMPGKAVCSLYEDRPLQCRTFPFWPGHLQSQRSWKALAKDCEGIGRGNLVPVEAIRFDRDLQRKDEVERGNGVE